MQTKVRVEGGIAYVEGIDPSDGAVFRSEVVGDGEQIIVTSIPATKPADLEFHGPEKISEATEPPATGGGEAEAEDEGEAAGDGAEPGETPQDEGEAPEPVTSEVTDLPLYKVEGDEAPEGFAPSDLEDPDGVTLYHYEGDDAGESARGGGEGVTVYADADDGSQPVCPVAAEGAGE